MKIKDIMTTDIIVVNSKQTVKQCAVIMRDNNIGFLPVVDNGLLTGVITDRDIVIRGVCEDKINDPISNIMTSRTEEGLITIAPDVEVQSGAKLMAENGIRRLVVVNDKDVVGVVTIKSYLATEELKQLIFDTYKNSDAIGYYKMTTNSNPHDTVRVDDFRL